jgi:hypothetical protein
VELDPSPIGQHPQGLDEVNVLDLTNERELVPRRPTSEAVVEALFGVDRERWRLLAMEGAQTGPPSPRFLQGHVLTDQSDDVGGRSDLSDLVW